MKRTGFYRPAVDGRGRAVVSHAGGTLLLRTAMAVGLDTALSAELGRWRRPTARHDPGRIVLDLAVSLAIGGDCLADIAQLRAQPGVFGPVASDPTVSRLIATLAADAPAALAATAAPVRCRPVHRPCQARRPRLSPHPTRPDDPSTPGLVEPGDHPDDTGRTATPFGHNQPHSREAPADLSPDQDHERSGFDMP